MAEGDDGHGGTGGGALLRSVASPWNLIIGGAGVIAGLALSRPWLVAVGVLAYLVLTGWRLSRRPAGRRAAAPGGERAEAVDPFTIGDPSLRDAATLVRRALDELHRVLVEAEALELSAVRRAVQELAARASRLARDGEQIWRYISREDPGVLRRDLDHLEEKARAAPDPAAARSWRDAAQAKRDHLKILTDLIAAHERVLASLNRIAASLDGLSAKVVRMGVLDAQAQESLTGDMSSELAQINAEVNAFEETLQPLVAGK